MLRVVEFHYFARDGGLESTVIIWEDVPSATEGRGTFEMLRRTWEVWEGDFSPIELGTGWSGDFGDGGEVAEGGASGGLAEQRCRHLGTIQKLHSLTEEAN